MISINQIIKEMLGHKLRLALTVLAIAWGTASISLMLSVGEGMRQNFGEAVASVGKGLLVVSGGITDHDYHGVQKGQKILLTQKDLDAVKLLIGIESLLGEYDFTAPVYLGDATTMSAALAVTPEFGTIRQIKTLPEGRFLNELDEQKRRHVIVLGNQVAKGLLDADQPKQHKRKRKTSLFADSPLTAPEAKRLLGKSVRLGTAVFTIVGVSQDKMQMSGYGNSDNYSLWIPASTYQALTGNQYYSELVIVPANPADIDELKKRITQTIARLHGVDPQDPAILSFWDSHEIQSKTNSLFLGMQMFLGLIGCITLIVAGIGIANVMYVSVRKATREIGLRLAIGARTYHILAHYLVEALLATLVGGLIGLLVSMGVVMGIGHLNAVGPMAQFIGNFKPVLSLPVVAIVMMLLGIVGFLAALFPALRASKVDPAIALQHD